MHASTPNIILKPQEKTKEKVFVSEAVYSCNQATTIIAHIFYFHFPFLCTAS